MDRLWIIGGTTEGRQLAEFCEKNGIPALVSVVSEYGEKLLDGGKYVRCEARALDREEMEEFLEKEEFSLVVDAAHPFAPAVHENIREACRNMRTEYIRCVRENTPDAGAGTKYADSAEEAADFLSVQEGNILLTTGSHTLKTFQCIPGWKERVFARVLPSSEAVRACEDLGFSGRHIIAMQGPFSREMNAAIIKETGASFLVTKESGTAGGFPEKEAAAADTGAVLVVIRRPRETGNTMEEIKELLRRRTESFPVVLAGIGPGATERMSEEVREAILRADILIGAGRMTDAALKLVREQEGRSERQAPEILREYRPAPAIEKIKEAGPHKKTVLLYSGDTTFYSGAEKMAEALREENLDYVILRGESSAAYFLEKIGIAPGRSAFASAHEGVFRLEDQLEAMGGKSCITILTGRSIGPGEICRELVRLGYGSWRVHTGERLSYPEEVIRHGTAKELAGGKFDTLSVICVEKKV
ncbi:MAG: precorrin-6A reductase [Clostridium sp.]|nr:precorrin-6A reductase [Clostridium sp.]